MNRNPLRLLLVAALLLVPLAARADPATIGWAIGYVASFSAAEIALVVFQVAYVAWAPVGASAARRDARCQAAEQAKVQP